MNQETLKQRVTELGNALNESPGVSDDVKSSFENLKAEINSGGDTKEKESEIPGGPEQTDFAKNFKAANPEAQNEEGEATVHES